MSAVVSLSCVLLVSGQAFIKALERVFLGAVTAPVEVSLSVGADVSTPAHPLLSAVRGSWEEFLPTYYDPF
jgi:hypothetical protein